LKNREVLGFMAVLCYLLLLYYLHIMLVIWFKDEGCMLETFPEKRELREEKNDVEKLRNGKLVLFFYMS
jgi:membrane-anchored glycerophosphoryl diester phosphodiesterase (GDPDase)